MGTNDHNVGNGTNNPTVITLEPVRVPDPATVTHWLSEIDLLAGELGSYVTTLTPADRRRALKIRRGGERHILLIADTAQRYGLSFPGGTADEIRAGVDFVNALSPVLTRLRAATEVVSDAILRARSNTWKGTTSAYTMLSRMSKNTPSIATEIAPATDFFAYRRKDKAAAASPAAVTKGGSVAAPATQPSGGDAAKADGAAASSNGALAPANGASPANGAPPATNGVSSSQNGLGH